MSEQNAFRGLSDSDKVAVLLEMVITAAAVGAAVNTALDALTEAQVQGLLGSFSGRLRRGTFGA